MWSNKGYSFKMDMWSLGCLIYEIAALRLPFESDNIYELLDQIRNARYEPIPDYFSKELGHLIKILLQINPKKRPTCGI